MPPACGRSLCSTCSAYIRVASPSASIRPIPPPVGRGGTESGRGGSDPGRGQDAGVSHVGPAAGGAGGEGAGEHLSRETRVASDEQLSSENPGGGETEAQGVLGQQALVGDPAHPVGAESCGSTFQLFSALEG